MTAADLFAGLGGSSEGARQAGVQVIWAANHWQVASDTHAANHPESAHSCQDLHQADWTQVPRHDATIASPSCQGHSPARGRDLPHHDAARSTAWAVVSCAEVHRSPVLLVENVVAFLKWTLFPAWELALQKLGYTLSINVLDAADHGVPQHRRRVFIIGTRTRAPFELRKVRLPHIAAETILDEAGKLRPVRTLCLRSRRRIARGREQHGHRFLVPYYSHGSGLGGRSLGRPIGTITTHDRFALVVGDKMRMLSVEECRRAMGFPASYQLPANRALAKHLLGNAVPPPVARDILLDLKARL